MKLSQFKFKLPEEKIALHPTKYRDESRLMVLHKRTGEIEHKMFKDILNYFDDKDVFVFNDTKVFPARLYKALYALGETPLPHTILNRPVEEEDAERFQSIFAKNEGAVTAPTASLHFSRELMKRMEIKGIDFAYITLHAGLGNFRDIDVEDLTKHKMDSEQMFVTEEAVKIVNRAKDLGKNVCAVGTTVMRAIESTVSTDGHLKEYEGWTNKFIFPPYDFTVANAMVSNFHMPLSTLLMIVAAFGGYDQVMDAYHIALKEGYRFGTYGDAMLILDK